MASDIVGHIAIEPLRILNQMQGVTKHCGSDGEFFAGTRQADSRPFSLILDLMQFGADFRLGERVICGEVDQPRLSFIKFF